MKTLLLPAIIVALIAVCSCGGKKTGHDSEASDSTLTMTQVERLPGDTTRYGLACEGCTDSVVVFLPSDDSDPITYNIIEAKRRGHVLGKIQTGDRIAVLLNPKDTTVADIVIDMDDLTGIWCYIVMPTLRDNATVDGKPLAAKSITELPDSVFEEYCIPREYGFQLKRGWKALSIGYVRETSSLAEESPVTYPPLGYFVSWHILNGQFVMVSGSPDAQPDDSKSLSYDTCSIDYLTPDSLVLTDRWGSRGYYKKSSLSDINRKANAVAAARSKQALEKVTAE